jgi:hypothetical protein
MKEVFREIAKKENGKLFIKDEIVSMGMGERSPNAIYTIRLLYRDVEITVLNEVGTTAIGTITCQFPFDIDVPIFELETRSNFFTLFRGQQNRFRITCKNTKFRNYLWEQISNPDILNFVKKYQFEPYLECRESIGEKTMKTEYNLLFEDWPIVISPLLNLNKRIIDWVMDQQIN